MVEIRLLQAADQGRVVALADRLTTGVASWRDSALVAATVTGWVADAVDHHDPGNSPVLVAVDGDNVVGFLAGGTRTHWSGEVDAYIGELVTDPASEGRGIGGALVTGFEAWALAHGFDRIALETGAANARAIGFYERRGYQHEEVVLSRALGR